MKARWVVEYGPEFAQSKRACRLRIGEFRLGVRLRAIKLNLERDPFLYSESYADDTQRVIETQDYMDDGFVLTAFVKLCAGFVARIMWIEMRDLPQTTRMATTSPEARRSQEGNQRAIPAPNLPEFHRRRGIRERELRGHSERHGVGPNVSLSVPSCFSAMSRYCRPRSSPSRPSSPARACTGA